MHKKTPERGSNKHAFGCNTTLFPMCKPAKSQVRPFAFHDAARPWFLEIGPDHCSSSHKHLSALLLALWHVLLADHLVPLLLHALLSPLARGLGLGTLRVHLLLQPGLALLLGLGFVDMLD